MTVLREFCKGNGHSVFVPTGFLLIKNKDLCSIYIFANRMLLESTKCCLFALFLNDLLSC